MVFGRLLFLCMIPILGNVAADCVSVSQKEAFKHATVVFQGRVVDVRDIPVSDQGITPGKVPVIAVDPSGPQLVTLMTERVWKGPDSDKIMVFAFRHPPQGDGYSFKVGQEYVIYTLGNVATQWKPLQTASMGGPVYDVGMCVLRVRNDIAKELRLLGRTTLRR
jgi:hypothetical protein